MPRGIFRSLRHRNYRLYFIGQATSLVGNWLTRFAMSWMAYRLTGSAFVLGLVAFCGSAPVALLSPLAGVLVDRWNLHRAILTTQVLGMIQSVALAAFAFTNTITVVHLAVLGALQGVITAFDRPARQTYMRFMIDDRADLPNAIALNSTITHGSRLIAPAFASILVVVVGEAWCFTLDASSYLAVIGAFLAMRSTEHVPTARRRSLRADLRAGFGYVAAHPQVRALLLLLAASTLLCGGYIAMMPLVAVEALHGGPYTLGVLIGSAGFGALTGSIYLANRTTLHGLGNVVTRAAFALGTSLCGLELARAVWLAVPLLFVTGWSMLVQTAASNTIVQTIVDADKLGRVMSLFSLAAFGAIPLGALQLGSLASWLGPLHALLAAGALLAAITLAFTRAIPQLAERDEHRIFAAR